jgi:hypothetical protein
LAAASIGCQSGKPMETRTSTPIVSGKSTGTTSVRGLDYSVGRIESMRTELRLVVLDYSLSTLPQLGDMLAVYRDGVEVGQVKVTGPFRAGTGKLGGEIVSGDIQIGDVVRGKSQ